MVVEVAGQGGGWGCWPGWWLSLLARVVAEIVGQVSAREAAGVSAGVAPTVCRSGAGGTPYCAGKKMLKSNFKNAVSIHSAHDIDWVNPQSEACE